MKKTRKIVFITYFLVLVVLGIITVLVPHISGALVKTEIIYHDTMKISDKAYCYIVRNEKVYLASKDGNTNYYVGDGIKVRGNTKILDLLELEKRKNKKDFDVFLKGIKGEEVTEKGEITLSNGVTSYYVDGYEGFFKPEKIKDLKYQQFEGRTFDMMNLTRKYAFKGEPLFKICDDKKWNIIYWIPESSLPKYIVGKDVRVKLPKGDIKAEIKDLLNKGDMWLVILETKAYYEDFHNIRMVEAEIITSEYSGIKVINSNIDTENGQAGVFVKQKNGDFVFTPIKIITSDGEYSLLKSDFYYDEDENRVETVEIYDEILKNPSEQKDDIDNIER